MEDFSALSRKEKVALFRKRNQELQTRRSAWEAKQILNVARKIGKDDALKMRIKYAMVQDLDAEQCRLWKMVLADCKTVTTKGETVMAVMEGR